eukprot:scaffold34024_cov118-Isochrysis_galbana.AAC.1
MLLALVVLLFCCFCCRNRKRKKPTTPLRPEVAPAPQSTSKVAPAPPSQSASPSGGTAAAAVAENKFEAQTLFMGHGKVASHGLNKALGGVPLPAAHIPRPWAT